MKKLIVSLLSLLLFFNSSLFIIIYGLRMLDISRDVSEQIQIIGSDEMVSQTVLIRVPLNDPTLNGSLKRVNESEINVNGFMYDIACQRIIEDTLCIFCLQDNEEDELITDVLEFFNHEGKDNSQIQYFNMLFSFLSNALVPQNNIYAIVTISIANIGTNDSLTCCAFPEIPSPPPKYII